MAYMANWIASLARELLSFAARPSADHVETNPTQVKTTSLSAGKSRFVYESPDKRYRRNADRFRSAKATTTDDSRSSDTMDKLKVFLGLMAIWGMIAWMAGEFAWDAWKNARRDRRQARNILECPSPNRPEPIDDSGAAHDTHKEKMAI